MRARRRRGRRTTRCRTAPPRSASGRGRGRGPRASSTTRSCWPRATGATSWTATATGRSRRSSPTSTRRRHDFHVAIENWQHDFNIGTIVRTANAFLAARGAHRRQPALEPARRDGHRPLPARAPPRRVADLAAHLRVARASRCWGIDNLPGSAAPRDEARLPRRVCLLFGQEGPGLSEAAREACDGTFSIAQFGSTRSINASAAAAIAMHTWVASTRTCPARTPGAGDG